jgi:membrane fusion protein, heavy metal efflux system
VRIALVLLIFAMAACSNRTQDDRPAAAAPAAEPGPRTVELSDAALREMRLEIVETTEKSIPQTIQAAGRLTTNEDATWRVGAITDGRIIEVSVKVGDQVKPRDVLARLYSHDIHEARAEYRRARSEVQRLEAAVDFAQRNRDRHQRLYETKAASLEQVDQVNAALRNEESLLASARIELNRTRLHLVEFLEISADDPAHPGSAEDLVPIRAPAAGTVLSREVTPGAVVDAARELFTISDLSTVWAVAAVQEDSLARLRAGMTADVRVQAYPERVFPGRVTRIDSRLDPETRTVSVRIALDNRAGLLKPEMYASVELAAGGTEPGIYIPQSALQDVNGQPSVFIERAPGRFEVRPVDPGRTLEGLRLITHGLRPGERIVAAGSFILKSQLLRATFEEE